MEENKKIRIVKAELYILPVTLRIPLKFGDQVLQSVSCARVRIIIENSKGKQAEGWGETPLSAAWVWPSNLEYNIGEKRLIEICKSIGDAYCQLNIEGHPFELGQKFIQNTLEKVKILRKEIDTKQFKTLIEIDGGINFENSELAKKAGVDILVSGTTIFKENDGDLKKNIQLLKVG